MFPKAIWRYPQKGKKQIYLTFDDGPIPEVTPWVLSVLREKGIKATFFCVGDNVRKHPDIFKMVMDEGHEIGNHTFNHLQGWQVRTKTFVNNVELAHQYLQSLLFRPPHGHMRFRQLLKLRKKYNVIMWDVVTRDYSRKQNAEGVLEVVKKYTQNGSIIVFHDSLKSIDKLKYALPLAIDYLKEQGYTFSLIGETLETDRQDH